MMRKPSENGRGGKRAPSERRDKSSGKPGRTSGKPSSSGFKSPGDREGFGDKKKGFGFEKKSGPGKEKRFSSDRSSGRSAGNKRFHKEENTERRSAKPFERKDQDEPKKSFSSKKYSDKKEGYSKPSFGGKTLKVPRKSAPEQEGSFMERRPKREKQVRAPQVSKHQDGTIRLNRFLSNAGLASRREADVMIEAGLVKINGKIITELGTRVNPEVDEIQYGGERIRGEKKVYILVNKPKNIITTTDDPEGRNTVMELIRDFSGKERVFPVGRLDRNTTGVLLLTNDGELSNKLTHPRYGVKKVYIVTIDKPLKPADRHRLLEGVDLEDGMVQADAVEFKNEKDKTEVFFEIHSGKNRIVRRMFESIGYEVLKLDRTLFGGLSKTGLRRGQWRILDETEVSKLKKL